MQQLLSKTLINKFLAQECTATELQVVSKALKTAEGKRLLDEVLLERWNGTMDADDVSELQLLEWNQELHDRINDTRKNKIVNFFHSKLFRYSAISSAVIAGIFIFINQKFNQPTKNDPVVFRLIANPNGKRSVITLPDSSVVYLGAGSKISFPETFASDKRDINLDGEAFFDVKHRSHQSFVVHTGELQTRDIGTSFKISAFKNCPVTIALATGEVSVERLKGKAIQVLAHLKPGQQSVWNNKTLATNTVPVNDITDWKDGHLVFDGVPLSELTAVIERWYNVKIVYNNNSRKRLLVTTRLTVANTSITAIMQALSVMEHFTYNIHGQKITIY